MCIPMIWKIFRSKNGSRVEDILRVMYTSMKAPKNFRKIEYSYQTFHGFGLKTLNSLRVHLRADVRSTLIKHYLSLAFDEA